MKIAKNIFLNDTFWQHVLYVCNCTMIDANNLQSALVRVMVPSDNKPLYESYCWPLSSCHVTMEWLVNGMLSMYSISHGRAAWFWCALFCCGYPSSSSGLIYYIYPYPTCLLHCHWAVLVSHWGRDKMDAILQTTLSNAFSWMKMHEFRLRFHWSLFPKFELTIFQHCFR